MNEAKRWIFESETIIIPLLNMNYQERLDQTRLQLEQVWSRSNPQGLSPLLPDAKDLCQVCLPWQEKLDASSAEYPYLDGNVAQYGIRAWLREHRSEIHRPINSVLQGLTKYRSKFISPRPEIVRGILTYFDPEETTGATDASIAFFLLNRHRLGAIQTAQMIDSAPRVRYELSLIDERLQRLSLRGCSSGYGGEGPAGTLFVLRLAGFPEGGTVLNNYGSNSALENLVHQQSNFILSKSV